MAVHLYVNRQGANTVTTLGGKEIPPGGLVSNEPVNELRPWLYSAYLHYYIDGVLQTGDAVTDSGGSTESVPLMNITIVDHDPNGSDVSWSNVAGTGSPNFACGNAILSNVVQVGQEEPSWSGWTHVPETA